jgi:transposase
MSAPGISFITAITVVAETSGFALINSGKQLTSYPGYDVVLRDSGNFKGKTRVRKKEMINLNQLSLRWETKYSPSVMN